MSSYGTRRRGRLEANSHGRASKRRREGGQLLRTPPSESHGGAQHRIAKEYRAETSIAVVLLCTGQSFIYANEPAPSFRRLYPGGHGTTISFLPALPEGRWYPP